MSNEKTFKDAKVGEKMTLDCMVSSVQSAVAVNGNAYRKLSMRDREGCKFSLTCFESPDIPNLTEGMVLTAEILKIEKNGDVFTNLCRATENKSLDASYFIAKAEIDVEAYFKGVIDLVGKIKEPNLRYLVKKTIAEVTDGFKTSPLTSGKEYARTAGVLEATSRLLTMVCYTPWNVLGYNKDVMIAGAALYYIGAVGSVEVSGADFVDTLAGRSVTDAISSHDRFRDAVRSILSNGKPAPDDEVIRIVDNILLSPVKGINELTPEAYALCRLSDIVLAKERYCQASDGTSGFVRDSKYHEWYVPVPAALNRQETAGETA